MTRRSYRKCAYIGFFLSGLSILLLIISVDYTFGWSGRYVSINCYNGVIDCFVYEGFKQFPWAEDYGFYGGSESVHDANFMARLLFIDMRWLPKITNIFNLISLEIPLWMFGLLFALLSAGFRKYGGRIRPGHCYHCDYDLTGNKSGVCSECGTDIPDCQAVDPNQKGE